MQVVENWATITGQVKEVRPDGEVVLHVTKAQDYESYPNLCSWAIGKELKVVVPKGMELPGEGSEVTWRVRVVGPGKAMPHPSTIGK